MLYTDDHDPANQKFKLTTYDYLPLPKKQRYDQAKSLLMAFACMTEQAIQIRSKPKQTPFVQSKIERTVYLDQIKEPMIRKNEKFNAIFCKGYRNQLILGLNFQKKSECDEFFKLLQQGLQLNKKAVSKSEFNYFPIEQNLRKIIQSIIFSSKSKSQLYYLLTNRLSRKQKELTNHQHQLLLKSLVNNQRQMQQALRKQKIQSFHIDKKQYISELKEVAANLGINKTSQKNQINQLKVQQVEGYTFKREMDGIVLINNQQIRQEKQTQLQKKFQQALCLNKIPHYSNIQLHQKFKSEALQIQEPLRNQIRQTKIIGKKLTIPRQKNFQILCDSQIKLQSKPKQQQQFNPKSAKAIQAVKLMYQMMKRNTQEVQRQNNQHSKVGPLSDLLDELKDILIQLQKQLERQKIDNKYFSEFIRQASKNYNQYKKFKFKFYQ